MKKSIRESFRAFRNAHPHTNVALTKFFYFRQREVKCSPQEKFYVCMYCANFKPCIASLYCACCRHVGIADLESMHICSPPSNECLLGNCGNCPKERHSSIRAPWHSRRSWAFGDGVGNWRFGFKKIRHLILYDLHTQKKHQALAGKWIAHKQMRSIQGKAIYTE